MKEKISLIQWLINQHRTEAYRKGTLCGMRHPQVDAKLLREVGGRESLIRQARELEKDSLGVAGKIRFQWRDMGEDIQKIDYHVDIIPELCKRIGVEDLRERQLRHIREIEKQLDGAKNSWLSDYYEELKRRLMQGKDVKEMEDKNLFQCLDGVAQLEKPMWKRLFSAKVFHNSKIFEKEYQEKVAKILHDYSPLCEEGMNEDEILAVNGILSYAQTLEWKGPLCYRLENGSNGSGSMIDTKNQIYGTIINAQTLEHAVPIAIPTVKRIMIIENKANYESMEYSEDTLYIFCHGFFSPKEMKFLRGLSQITEEDTKYYHWGDMDYGGIRIFQFNKKNLFPKLEPYQMGKEEFQRAVQIGGIPLEDKKREKLEKLCAGDLEELKQCILESGMEIEQELLLAEM